MNLEKELNKEKSKRLDNQEQLISSTKLLLESNAQKEREVLRSVGLADEIIEVEKKIELGILNKQYEELYEGKIYHYDELYKLGMKYRLFLRNSKFYRGSIPPDLGSILVRLKEKHNLNMNGSVYGDSGRVFILAPPKMFKNYYTVGDKIQALGEDTEQGLKSFIKSFQDPCALYKVDENHYLFLKAWGKDFSIIRRIYGFFSESTFWIRSLFITSYFLLLYNIKSLFLFLWESPFSNNNGQCDNIVEFLVYGGTLIGILGLIVLSSLLFFKCIFDKPNSNPYNNYNMWSLKYWSTKYQWTKRS